MLCNFWLSLELYTSSCRSVCIVTKWNQCLIAIICYIFFCLLGNYIHLVNFWQITKHTLKSSNYISFKLLFCKHISNSTGLVCHYQMGLFSHYSCLLPYIILHLPSPMFSSEHTRTLQECITVDAGSFLPRTWFLSLPLSHTLPHIQSTKLHCFHLNLYC